MIKNKAEIEYTGGEYEVLGTFIQLVIPSGKTDAGTNRPGLYKFMMEETGEILEVRSFLELDDIVGSNIKTTELYKITVQASMYREKEQLRITHFEKVEGESERKVLQSSDVESVKKEIKDLIHHNIKNDEFLKILNYFMGDENAGFYVWPAAIGFHHAYVGGLAEHSLSVAKMSIGLFDNFPSNKTMSRELTITGALLHDIGKLREYSEDKHYQLDGNLYGHLLMGVEMINEAVNTLGLNPGSSRIKALKHIIASHHVDPAKGSIVRPALREVLIVGNADNLDAMDNYLEKYLGSTDNNATTERVDNHGGVRYWKHTIID